MYSIKSKTTLILFSSMILTVGYPASVTAVSDAELEALEKQIEQMETEEKEQAKAEEKMKAEAKRKTEQKRKTNAEAEKKRLAELEKQRIEEKEHLAKESKKREEEEKKKKYTMLITEANQAINDKDKILALKKFNEVLTLYPGDAVAQSGVKEAEKLMDKFCYQITGTWKQPELGGDVVNFFDNGVVSFKSLVVSYQNTWECNPEQKEISMDILNNVQNAKIYTFRVLDDGNKIYFKDAGQLYLEKINEKINKDNKSIPSTEINNSEIVQNFNEKNVCSEIIGVWRWNDLSRTITRFYEDGKVVSKNILKSEGNWECVDPENKRFTFNTWNEKREIQIEDDYKKLHSVSALGGKIIANKISDDPFEKIVPAKNSSSNVPGL